MTEMPTEEGTQTTTPNRIISRSGGVLSRLRSGAHHIRPIEPVVFYREEVEDNPEEKDKRLVFRKKNAKEIVLKSYKFVRLLGEGGFGQVSEYVEEKTGKHVALKHIRCMGTDSFISAWREIKALSEMKHDYIINIYDAFWDSSHCYYTMPVFQRGGLDQIIKKHRDDKKFFSTQTQAIIMFQLASALNYLHSIPFIHRDISANNVMVDVLDETKGLIRVVLSDFGTGQDVNSSRTVNFTRGGIGKQFYMAPEQGGENTNYSVAIDIWALGILFCQILTLRQESQLISNDPSVAVSLASAMALKDEKEVLYEIEKNILQTRSNTHIPNGGHITLVRDMLRKSSKERPTAKEVLDRCIYAMYEIFSGCGVFAPILRMPISILETILDSDYFMLEEKKIFALIENRNKEDIERLYQCLRIPLLDPMFLYEHIRPIIQQSRALHDRYMETMEYRTYGAMFLEKNGLLGEKRFSNRIPHPKATIDNINWTDNDSTFVTFKFQTHQTNSVKIMNDGRTIEKLSDTLWDVFAFADIPILNDGNSIRFCEIKVDKIASDGAGIVLGIWPTTLDNDITGRRLAECYGVSMNGRVFHGNATPSVKEVNEFKSGDICKISLDFSTCEFSMQKNSILLFTIPFNKSVKQVYPCAFLCFRGDKVSVLDIPAKDKKNKFK